LPIQLYSDLLLIERINAMRTELKFGMVNKAIIEEEGGYCKIEWQQHYVVFPKKDLTSFVIEGTTKLGISGVKPYLKVMCNGRVVAEMEILCGSQEVFKVLKKLNEYFNLK
jgi:stalled ribosome rescue protein Dom34